MQNMQNQSVFGKHASMFVVSCDFHDMRYEDIGDSIYFAINISICKFISMDSLMSQTLGSLLIILHSADLTKTAGSVPHI